MREPVDLSQPLLTTVRAGIFFKYDLEPMSLTIRERTATLLDFLVRLAGIVGGILGSYCPACLPQQKLTRSPSQSLLGLWLPNVWVPCRSVRGKRTVERTDSGIRLFPNADPKSQCRYAGSGVQHRKRPAVERGLSTEILDVRRAARERLEGMSETTAAHVTLLDSPNPRKA